MFLVIYGLITILLIIYILIPVFQNEDELIEMRKRQTESVSEKNKIKYRLNKALEKRVKYSTREKYHLLIKQAGLNISVSDFLGLSLITSVTLSLSTGYLFNNILIAIGFIFVGFFVPYQVVKFLRNRRVEILERQIGSFLEIVTERFKTMGNMAEALTLTAKVFQGNEPIYTELKNIMTRVSAGYDLIGSLEEFSVSTNNQFVELFVDLYKIAVDIGTDEAIESNMTEVLKQYKENRKAKQRLRSRIATPKRDAMIMLMMIPGVMFYQASTNADYVRFMTQDSMGQAGSFVLTFVFIACFWFINSKIGAPID